MTVWLRPMPPLTLIPGALATLTATGGAALALVLLAGGPVPASLTPPPPAVDSAAGRVVRVRVIRRAAEITLDDPGVWVTVGAEGAAQVLHGVRAMRAEGEFLVIAGERGELAHAASVELSHPAGVRADGRVLPARLRVRVSDQRLEAIAELPIEQYVAGVVSAEMFAHWPASALQAQSIVARSYAIHECARAGARAWHLDGSTSHQSFTSGPTEAALAAADQTRGLVLLYHGELLRTYYSSVCGGRAASAADQWGATRETAFNDAPPLRACERRCPCDDAPRHRWRATMMATELRDRLRTYGAQNGLQLAAIGTPRTCHVIDRNEVGRPMRYRLTDDVGQTFELRAEPMRLACNAEPREVDGPGAFPGSPAAPLPPFTPRSRPGPASDPDADPSLATVWSNDFEMRISRGEVTIEGRGFGHGVGLCQYGAKALADDGWTATRIVEHYYPGAVVAPAP
ncbi:MAG: SpoIID/LytB domain-containing protein [Phycisphaerales bacterium]|nr:SpoIID/LytB domain-containing protein [Phycisphaerales bacterium]